MVIRPAVPSDENAIFALNLLAFGEEEGELVATLAKDLLQFPPEVGVFTWVAEENDKLIGHIAFSPVHHRDNQEYLGQTLAPLSVHPDRQKSGIGSQLIQTGLDQFRRSGTNLMLVYGDPAYYGRFGFKAEEAANLIPPHPLKYPFGWLALHLMHDEAISERTPIATIPPLDKAELW